MWPLLPSGSDKVPSLGEICLYTSSGIGNMKYASKWSKSPSWAYTFCTAVIFTCDLGGGLEQTAHAYMWQRTYLNIQDSDQNPPLRHERFAPLWLLCLTWAGGDSEQPLATRVYYLLNHTGNLLLFFSEYVHECVKHILTLYKHKKNPPTSVLLVGHSMVSSVSGHIA